MFISSSSSYSSPESSIKDSNSLQYNVESTFGKCHGVTTVDLPPWLRIARDVMESRLRLNLTIFLPPLSTLLRGSPKHLETRLVSLLEFNIPGNPWISEFSSVQSQFHQSPSQPDPPYQRKTCDQCIIPDEFPTCPISGDVEDEEGGYFDYMGDGEGDEDEDDGGEEEEDVGSASQRPAKPLPPAVKNGYQNALEFLKKTGPNSKPKLYETLQTFWIPCKAHYFLLHGKSKPYPEQLYNYHWFFWDPDHLVEGGLKCSTCNNPLHCHGFTHPSWVVDVYYMSGQRHLCHHCRHPRTNELSVTFNSWDS
jgi:hypothetical protein